MTCPPSGWSVDSSSYHHLLSLILMVERPSKDGRDGSNATVVYATAPQLRHQCAFASDGAVKGLRGLERGIVTAQLKLSENRTTAKRPFREPALVYKGGISADMTVIDAVAAYRQTQIAQKPELKIWR